MDRDATGRGGVSALPWDGLYVYDVGCWRCTEIANQKSGESAGRTGQSGQGETGGRVAGSQREDQEGAGELGTQRAISCSGDLGRRMDSDAACDLERDLELVRSERARSRGRRRSVAEEQLRAVAVSGSPQERGALNASQGAA